MTHRCAYSGEVPGAKAHRDYIMADVTIRERCTERIAAAAAAAACRNEEDGSFVSHYRAPNILNRSLSGRITIIIVRLLSRGREGRKEEEAFSRGIV